MQYAVIFNINEFFEMEKYFAAEETFFNSGEN